MKTKLTKTRILKLTSGSALMAIAALTLAFSFASGQTAEPTVQGVWPVQGVWRTMAAALKLGASNEFTTHAAIEVFDAFNNQIATGCATTAGTRFE